MLIFFFVDSGERIAFQMFVSARKKNNYDSSE